MQFLYEIFVELICMMTGSYIWWNLKGRKGNFSDFPTHDLRDGLIGLLFWLVIIATVAKVIY